MAHEILIHARSVTSKEADARYLAQSAACIDFSGAIRHVLDSDEPRTPEPQVPVKTVTPSTTTTDRSDLVLDSQRGKRIKLTYKSSIRAASTNDFPVQHSFSRLNMFPNTGPMVCSLRSGREGPPNESSHAMMIESEKLGSYDSAIKDTQLQLLDYTSMSEYVPTAMYGASETTHMISKLERPVLSNLALHQLNRTISAEQLARPINTSEFTAREAIAYKEQQAYLRRRSNHCGLDRVGLPSSRRDSHEGNSKNRTEGYDMDKSSATWGLLIANDYTLSGNVDISLTRTTDANHGEPRTPTSEERTTNESGKTDRVSLEHDLNFTSFEITPRSSRIGTTFSISKKLTSGSQYVPKTTDNLRASCLDSFVLAQYLAPFYRPSFQLDTAEANNSSDVPIVTSKRTTTNEHENRFTGVTKSHLSIMNILPNSQSKKIIYDNQNNQSGDILINQHSNTNVARSELLTCDTSLQAQYVEHEKIADVTNCVIESPIAHSTAIQGQIAPDIDSVLCDAGQFKDTTPVKDIGIIRDTPLLLRNAASSISSNTNKSMYDDCVPFEYRSGDKFVLLMPPQDADDPYTVPSRLLALRTPRRIKRQSRELIPEERGFWQVDLRRLHFPLKEARVFWKNLESMIVSQKLFWVSLQYYQSTIRIYCFGSYAIKIWTMIYASSKSIKPGIPWLDYNNMEVLFN